KQPSTDDRVDWKALDGAFGVVAALLTQFQKQPPSGFCMGSHSMQYLPAVLLCELKPAVYQAMHHTQLSVRENATAALIHYVALSDAFTQIATFQEVISKLNLYSPHEVLPAAHAEGLLDVAAQLVPHIPLSFLVKHWQVVFPTCEKYVMHVASTVRQKSAGWSLFVCGQTHSNSQDLIGALAQLSIAHTDAIPLLVSILDSLALPCTPHPDVNQRDFFWQRMEGRLMSIECLVQVLGMNRLCWASPYLVQPTKPIRAFQAYAQTVDEYNRYDNVYATDMAPLASWVTGHDDKVARQPAHCILAHVKTPLGRFWHAYVSHAYLCFQSPQYELKRMAAQTLPGLMRLSLWLHDESPSLFPSWLDAQPTTVLPAFLCHAVKSLALHTRFLQEASVLDANVAKAVAPTVGSAQAVLQQLEATLTTVDVTPPQSVEKALGLAYVEVGSLVLLQHATSSPSTDSHTTALLLSVVDVMWAYHSSQPAVDRSMSSIVVRYFPGLALLSLDAAQATKLMTIALAWLAAEDSVRQH
ncbi:hypothetical protein As57867_006954, partial [Aphanomyces stellatus]